MLHVASCREVDYQNANTVLSAKTQNTCSCLIVTCSCQSTKKKPEAEAHVRLHTLLHVVTCCCVLLGVRRKVLTRSNFWVNNSPNFFKFVPWSPKLSATMLPFALFFQHYWGHACALHLVSKVLWVVSFPRCTACPNIVRSCCICLHITANIDATTPIIVGPPMLGVVWSICK